MSERVRKSSAGLYQGLWRMLTGWFAVPEHPPDLPATGGEMVERFRPSPDFLRYLKFRLWVGLTALDGALFLAWIASFFESIWLGLALAPVFLAIAVLPAILAFVAIHLQYDTTWYVLSSRSLRIRRGIWVIRETTITFENVQNVKIQQGPVQRYFGTADVHITTAGGGAAASEEGGHNSRSHVGLIEGASDAGRIRDLILATVRRSGMAGVNDEDHVPSPSSSTIPAWTAEHLQVLREIRDELASVTTTR